jgi:hypothetical protein
MMCSCITHDIVAAMYVPQSLRVSIATALTVAAIVYVHKCVLAPLG